MDDFTVNSLTESRNEYSALLIGKLTPCIIQGINAIFNDACELCVQNDEDEKYLMTFQNFLARVTKWNPEIIQRETERIVLESNCQYLEDLLTCVHITQLKVLTNIRVGSKQKKITIDIPKLDDFIHKCYIESARKVYKNVFLFDKSTTPLNRQKNSRELELIITECIVGVIRNNMPVEEILKAYLEEDIEDSVDEVKTEVKEVIEPTDEEIEPVMHTNGGDSTSNGTVNGTVNGNSTENEIVATSNTDNEPQTNHTNEIIPNEIIPNEVADTSTDALHFSNVDEVKRYNTDETIHTFQNATPEPIKAPKDIQTLEQISEIRNQIRKEDDEGYDDEILNIHDDVDKNITLDIEKISSGAIQVNTDSLLGEIEELS